LPSQPHQN